MMWTKDNMFEPSGCLTRETFEALVNHQLPADAKVLADEHLASCPFCADALEGFTEHAGETEFAVLIDKADKGFNEIIAEQQTKPSNRRTLWISISAAASILMLVGLFLLMNHPQVKNQMAQSLPKDSNVTKPKEETKAPLPEPLEKVKQPAFETKSTPPVPEKRTIQNVQPEMAKGGEAPANSDNAIVVETQTNVPKVAPPVTADKMIVAEDASKDIQKETEELKKESNKSVSMGFAKAKREAESPAVKRVSSDEAPVSFVEQMPEYPGGQDAMMKFIRDNLKYPQTATEMGISGKIIAQFIVEKNGKISNIKIIRSLSQEFDNEVIRVIKLMPKWVPGSLNGKPSSLLFTLPINIDLKE